MYTLGFIIAVIFFKTGNILNFTTFNYLHPRYYHITK